MHNYLQTRILPFAFLLLISIFSQQANALQMEPLSLVLKPSGGGSSQTLRVTNNSGKPIAVQFNITTRQQLNNKEIRHPADDQFMIYPPQTIIPAHTTQKIRVKWLGSTKLASEKAYRLIAEQVYVSLEKEDKSAVRMLMTLVGSLYIQPSKTNSKLVVKKVQSQGNKLAITVSNTGTRHQLMKKMLLTLNNEDKTLTLDNNHLKGLIGNNILAGATRTFTIPLPTGFANGQWKARLDSKK